MADDDIQFTGNLILRVERAEQQVNALLARLNSVTISPRIDSAPLGRLTGQVSEFERSLGAANARVAAFGASALIFGAVAEAVRGLVRDSLSVDKALNDINITLKANQSDLRNFSAGIFNVARDTAQSFKTIAQAAQELSHQGLSIEEVGKRVKDAAVLMRSSNLGAAEAVRTLTTATNSYQKEGLTFADVNNKITAVSQRFAVSQRDLADALTNVSATAQQSHVPFDQLLGIITSLARTTGQKGGEISNGLNSIFTRTRRSDTLDQLERLGVVVRDVAGNTLPAIQVLQNLAKAQQGASDSTKSFIGQLTAGIFQANRANAIYNDLAKTSGTLAQATGAAANSGNAAYAANAQRNKPLEEQFKQTGVSATQAASSVGSAVFSGAAKNVLNIADTVLGFVNGESTGAKFANGFFKAVGAVLSGPGLAIGAVLVTKLAAQFITFAANASKTILSTADGFGRVATIEKAILELSSKDVGVNNALNNSLLTQEQRQRVILDIIQQRIAAETQLRTIATETARGLYVGGQVSTIGTKFVNSAAGQIPAEAALREVATAKKAGYAINLGDVRSMNANIGGHPTNVIYNSRERVIHNFGGSGEPAIIPPTGRIGFAGGHIPNFANKYDKDDFNHSGLLVDSDYHYIYAGDNAKIDAAQRLAARQKGFEILTKSDAEYLTQNSDILKGHTLKVIDPTAQFHDEVGKGNFKVLGANAFRGDKLREAKLSKYLPQSIGLDDFTNTHGIDRRDVSNFFGAANESFGNNYFVKARANAQGKGVFGREAQEFFFHRLPKGEDYFIQKAIENVSGREFRVGLAGVGRSAQSLSVPLLRGDNGRLNHEFFSNTKVKDNLFSKTGIGTFLSRQIAESQAKRAFSALPLEDRSGAIAGLDVLETGNKGIAKFGQFLAEKIGLGRFVKGGGVAEFNFSQNQRSVRQFGGQAGQAGSLDRTDVLINAGQALLKNRERAFAEGYVPGLEDAMNRESAAAGQDNIRIGQSSYLASGFNPLGLGVYNTKDEPRGLDQGINRAISEGRNPKSYGVPNFADNSDEKYNRLAADLHSQVRNEINNYQNSILDEVLSKKTSYDPTISDNDLEKSTRRADAALAIHGKELSRPRRGVLGTVRHGIAGSFRETEGTRAISSHAFNASILSAVGGSALQQYIGGKEGNQLSDAVGGVSQAIGTGAGIASAVPGPAGIAIGAVVAGFGSLKSVLDNLTPSFERLRGQTDAYVQKQQATVSAIQGVSNTSDTIKDLYINGGSPTAIKIAQNEQRQHFAALDPETRKAYRRATNQNAKDSALLEGNERATNNAINASSIQKAVDISEHRSAGGFGVQTLRGADKFISSLFGVKTNTLENLAGNKDRHGEVGDIVSNLSNTSFGFDKEKDQKALDSLNDFSSKNSSAKALKGAGFNVDFERVFSGLGNKDALSVAKQLLESRIQQTEEDKKASEVAKESALSIRNFNNSISGLVATVGSQRQIRNSLTSDVNQNSLSAFSQNVSIADPYTNEIGKITNQSNGKRFSAIESNRRQQESNRDAAREELERLGKLEEKPFNNDQNTSAFRSAVRGGLDNSIDPVKALQQIQELPKGDLKEGAARDAIIKSRELLNDISTKTAIENNQLSAILSENKRQTDQLINVASFTKSVNNYGGSNSLNSTQDLSGIDAGRAARRNQILEQNDPFLQQKRRENVSNTTVADATNKLNVLRQAEAARQKVIGAGILEEFKNGSIPTEVDIAGERIPRERDNSTKTLLSKRQQLKSAYIYEGQSRIIGDAQSLIAPLSNDFKKGNLTPGFDESDRFARLNRATASGDFQSSQKILGEISQRSNNAGKKEIADVLQQLPHLQSEYTRQSSVADARVGETTKSVGAQKTPDLVGVNKQEINSTLKITLDGKVNNVTNPDEIKNLVIASIANLPALTELANKMAGLENRTNNIVSNNGLKDTPTPPVSYNTDDYNDPNGPGIPLPAF